MAEDELHVVGRHVTQTGVQLGEVFIVGEHRELGIEFELEPGQGMPEELVVKIGVRAVGLWILDEGIDRPHEFLVQSNVPVKDIPILSIRQVAEIADWIERDCQGSIPVIKGLVLAGGRSQRMGENKAYLKYHDAPQVIHACEQIEAAGISATISQRWNQSDSNSDRYPVLYDRFLGLGPFGAILSAFQSDPDAAWLVIACDQPLLRGANPHRNHDS